MTTQLNSENIATIIQKHISSSDYYFENNTVVVDPSQMITICQVLKTTPGIELDYLSSITAVDYLDYFELVYLFYSIVHNHCLTMKVRCPDKKNPSLPSITSLYNGANFQEREIYDLFGISFTSHPKLNRIFLWEGFHGHPLRKDYESDS
ncbi:MAG: NADH-quinone oxidoreductase subunit C [Dehalococcoidales bacterium]